MDRLLLHTIGHIHTSDSIVFVIMAPSGRMCRVEYGAFLNNLWCTVA